MADSYALALQAGLIAAIGLDADVAALVGTRIYDEPPAAAQKPYLRISEITPRAFHTDTKRGALVQIGIEAHSTSASGRVEAVQVVEAVQAALDRQETSVTVAGFSLIELIFQTYTSRRNPAGRGYTATIAFQAMLEE